MRRGSLQALAIVVLLAALVVMGVQNLQLWNFHLFIGLLVVLIAGVLLVFAISTRNPGAEGRGLGREATGRPEKERRAT